MSLSIKPNSLGNGATLEYNGTPAVMLNAGGGGFPTNLQTGMTNLLYPSVDGSYRDQYRSGWLPAGFNQQWGGSQWGAELIDGATGTLHKFDVATGQIEDNASGGLSNGAATYYQAQGFTIAETMTLDAVWLKLYKIGNPTGNITVRIYTNNAGAPNAAIGSAVTVPCKQLNSKTDGEMFRFSGLASSLVKDTAYHIVATLGTTDAVNYVGFKRSTTSKYAFSAYNTGTSTPVWSPVAGYSFCFLIENPTSSRFLLSGGQFDGKLVFGADTYPSQIKALSQPMKNFFDGKEFTVLLRGKGTKGKSMADFAYGLDHDRVLLSCNATTGYAQVDVYDQAGTKRTVTGTTDVSAAFSDVSVHVRSKADGSDKIELFVNGVSEGTPLTGLTLTFDPLMRDLGNATLGGGFAVAPTWTQKLDMTTLPSANGWTWTGTGTEANCMSVSGGKLYQNKNGYGSTNTGYYIKTVTLSNATGWCVEWKGRVPSNTNTSDKYGSWIQASDGSKLVQIIIQEYYIQSVGSGAIDFALQGDFKNQESAFRLCGKGSDYYLFMNGKLLIDGTGKLTQANGSNAISFGDVDATASENADAIWDYVAYSTAGMMIPQASGELSEFAYFSGDKTSYLPNLYNSGTPISVKQFTGQSRNYIGEGVVQREVRKGVTSSPTTTSTTPVLLTDMECYVVGGEVSPTVIADMANSSANAVLVGCAVDGGQQHGMSRVGLTTGYSVSISQGFNQPTNLGLHKAEARWAVTGTTASNNSRTLTVEAKS